MEIPRKRRLSTNIQQIQLNDDASERLINRRLSNKRSSLIAPSRKTVKVPKAQAPHRNSAPFFSPFKSNKVERETLTDSQLTKLYTETVRLAADGKINQKNTWSINLIDYIDDLLSNEKKEAEAKVTNSSYLFRKASNTIDASIKIYSSRVDSVHSQMYKVLGGLNANPKEDQRAENADEDQTPGEKARRQVRKKVETLLRGEKAESVCLSESDFRYEIDPMFFKMASAFDEGGAKGLLLKNLELSDDFELIFDSDLPLKSNVNEQKNALDELDDKEEEPLLLSDKFSNLVSEIAKNSEKEIICPLLNVFGSEVRRIKTKIKALKDQAAEKGKHIDSDEEIEYPSAAVKRTSLLRPSEINAQLPEEKSQLFDSDDDDGFEGIDDFNGDVPDDHNNYESTQNLKNDLNFAEEPPEKEVEEALSEFGNTLQNWAGPNFWKFNRSKAKKSQDENKTKNQKPVKKSDEDENLTKKMKLELIDLAALTRLDELLEKEDKTKSKKQRKRRRSKAFTTLPVDMHLKADIFLRPFYRPHLRAKIDSLENGSELEEDGEVARNVQWYNYQNPNDKRYCADVDEALAVDYAPDADDSDLEDPFGGPFQPFDDDDAIIGSPKLMAPKGLEAETGLFSFASLSSEVNVRKLKSSLWSTLKTIKDKQVGEKEKNNVAKGVEKDGEKDVEKGGESAKENDGDKQKDKIEENMENDEKAAEKAAEKDAEKESEQDAEKDDEKDCEQNEEEENQENNLVSFKKSVEEVRKKNRQMQNVSVQYCFVCLLHLANENSLELKQLEPLGDFDIEIK